MSILACSLWQVVGYKVKLQNNVLKVQINRFYRACRSYVNYVLYLIKEKRIMFVSQILQNIQYNNAKVKKMSKFIK